MTATDWDIRPAGRSWSPQEIASRWALTPEKIELIDGRIFWSDEDRLNMLGLLLESVGADQVVRLGRPEVWRDAVARLQ